MTENNFLSRGGGGVRVGRFPWRFPSNAKIGNCSRSCSPKNCSINLTVNVDNVDNSLPLTREKQLSLVVLVYTLDTKCPGQYRN